MTHEDGWRGTGHLADPVGLPAAQVCGVLIAVWVHARHEVPPRYRSSVTVGMCTHTDLLIGSRAKVWASDTSMWRVPA
ncbi:hypothetical protein UO65_0235 [Actinokineospora spheciospongiae]|uniref:Uncharacterized protein n=1 Tax=Actinokineospora spheciospongiae TaxID=909613 RepID=W7IVK4_9PSEU|nr:hypothetical protein UO65_0235 [Actinokineospora spheciospongiae]